MICNFSGVPVHGYELDLPEAGVWHEILNTDAPSTAGRASATSASCTRTTVGRASMVLPPLGRAVAAARSRGAHPVADAAAEALGDGVRTAARRGVRAHG